MTPREFLELLFGDKPEHLYILIWTLQDKRSRWYRSIDEAASFVEICQDVDVYVGVGLSPEDYGPHNRCPADQIAGIGSTWADLDVLSAAHAKKALPPTLDDALSIVPASMPPTVTVSTGNGGHGWWLLKEPWIFESEQERARAAALVYRWQTMLRFNAANRGWAFERLADLPRILRIPGTLNHKDPEHPRNVEVVQTTGRRYSISEIEEFLDGLGIPGPDAHQPAACRILPAATELVIDPNAEVPEHQIKAWVDSDLRFRNTWFRQRHDLKDQSQSGYDLALADFGIDAGLTPQQIVDLLVHHRRMHRQKQRLRPDYFERTIARAADRGASSITLPGAKQAGSIVSAGVAPACPPEPDAQEPVDPMAAKAALCEWISQMLGVRILRLVKITGKDPTYQIELENARIELSSVAKLIDQSALRIAIAAAVNKLIPKFKPKDWEKIAQAMLDALVEYEGGVETELEGSMRAYLGQYLADRYFIERIEGQVGDAVRRPMVINGQIAVNSIDVQGYVNKQFNQAYTVKAIASMLAAIGARSIRARGTKIREQSRWLLPAEDFPPEEFRPHLKDTQGDLNATE